ncbi:MAG: glycoside hydrolase [Burkholderiales bacterium]|nr:MAG: glycoside hydrolase [Burkholderiales bacterium]
MKRPAEPPAARADRLIAECRQRSVDLLRDNLTPFGIAAAYPAPRSRARRCTAIFGRDAAVCAIGMALSGDAALQRAAALGLHTLAVHQAPNGQIPKFVDPEQAEADFWYLGCIDSTLWWLAAIAVLDRLLPDSQLQYELAVQIDRALLWLQAQEHQRFFLLQQNEASDWADIMPRSGFVLYTNALWYWVKRLYEIPCERETRWHANHLLHPFDAQVAEYRRARLLVHYVKRQARRRHLYLSFVNLASFGDEGDVVGNLLAVLCGLPTASEGLRVLQTLQRAGVADPCPVRVVCDPITESHRLWRPYMSRHRQNHAWQYHNGGSWPFAGGFWVAAMARAGMPARAVRRDLARLASANSLGDWSFNEWLHGRTLVASGMPRQSWNAAAFLIAEQAAAGRDLFAVPRNGAAAAF